MALLLVIGTSSNVYTLIICHDAHRRKVLLSLDVESSALTTTLGSVQRARMVFRRSASITAASCGSAC